MYVPTKKSNVYVCVRACVSVRVFVGSRALGYVGMYEPLFQDASQWLHMD